VVLSPVGSVSVSGPVGPWVVSVSGPLVEVGVSVVVGSTSVVVPLVVTVGVSSVVPVLVPVSVSVVVAPPPLHPTVAIAATTPALRRPLSNKLCKYIRSTLYVCPYVCNVQHATQGIGADGGIIIRRASV
jgi:hypothetical protein